MPTHADCARRARETLTANDRGGYTVPTGKLYPFQWNWDSAFVAMGFATYDVARAYRELEMLASGQWDDGMIPQIVFHAPSDSYFPGPAVWQTAALSPRGGPQTSGITQPPVFATALRRVHEAAVVAGYPRRREQSAALFRAALRNHRWWCSARDPDATGLVSILHPWETGSDNSPAWDSALARVATTTATVIARKDTGHVAAAMRPRDVDYQRYIHLVEAYAATGWQAAEQWRIAPFKIAEVQMTAILARASDDLAVLGEVFACATERTEIADMRARLAAGLRRQWRPALSRFVSRDLVSGADIETPTQAGFLPLAALDLDAGQCSAVASEIERWLGGQAIDCLPSVPGFAREFEAKRYWRGPVWAIINWYVVEGLRRNCLATLADRLERGMVRAMQQAGFPEYFDPLTGEGCGGAAFSWTAAAYLVMAREVENE